MRDDFDLEGKFSVAALRSVSSDEDFRSIETGEHVYGRPILVGLDSEDLRHLLVPVTKLDDAKVDAGHAILVRGETFTGLGGQSDLPFANIQVREKALNKVFRILCEDYLGRLRESTLDPMVLLEKVINDWRRLLVKGQQGLNRENALGLTGELEILRLLVETGGPDRGFATWQGASRRLHDFTGPRASLETKTIPAGSGNRIKIGALEQLDPGSAENLHLAIVELEENEVAPSLANRVDELQNLGLDKRELLHELKLRGYAIGIDDQNVHRFFLKGIRYWSVTEDFPSPQRKHFPEAVLAAMTAIAYQLAPESFPPDLEDGARAELFDHLLGVR